MPVLETVFLLHSVVRVWWYIVFSVFLFFDFYSLTAGSRAAGGSFGEGWQALGVAPPALGKRVDAGEGPVDQPIRLDNGYGTAAGTVSDTSGAGGAWERHGRVGIRVGKILVSRVGIKVGVQRRGSFS